MTVRLCFPSLFYPTDNYHNAIVYTMHIKPPFHAINAQSNLNLHEHKLKGRHVSAHLKLFKDLHVCVTPEKAIETGKKRGRATVQLLFSFSTEMTGRCIHICSGLKGIKAVSSTDPALVFRMDFCILDLICFAAYYKTLL